MPSQPDLDQLRSIKSFPSLVKYLRDELDWPIDPDNVDDLTFEYTPEELGFDPKHAVKIREIKQLRPLVTGQPWGIFWVSFEKKKLPMVVLRRILGKLIAKSRATADKATRPTWHLHDLLFISSYGEEEHRNISFAHFSESVDSQLPVLRVLGWDDQNSIMNLDRVANRLRSCLRWPGTPGGLAMWRVRWSGAFTERYGEPIESAQALIVRLAEVASGIRKRALAVLEAETEHGPMRKLFTAVRGLLIHDMSEDQFADMYAQTVSYGLLSASFSRPAGINPENLVQLTKITNPFLESLLESLFRLNRGKFHFDVDEVGVNDVLDLLRATNLEAIKAAFNDLNPAEDPVVRFYEGFLKAYDSEQRIKRGVFFTPRPVVSYIVRSVHELLQTEFGLEDGLASTATWANVAAQMERRRVLAQQEDPAAIRAFEIPKGVSPDDPFILILDVATGTATFLNECIEVIERTLKTKWARELGKPDPESRSTWRDPKILARWCDYVPSHLLPRLYGFEIMMAPYAIAHVKLALKLGETGYQFREGDRLHIYPTNTLEPPSDIADAKLADLFGPLAREAQEVNQVKRTKRFTLVVGNPPYSASISEPQWLMREIEAWKQGLNETKIDLNREEWKFLRMAELLCARAPLGIVGFIINRDFLDGIAKRKMREHLGATFARRILVDLNGDVKGNIADENVFEIAQGVAIALLCRGGRQSHSFTSLVGSRESKCKLLTGKSGIDQRLQDFEPTPPYFRWLPGGAATAAGFEGEYLSGFPINEAFAVYSSGIQTKRDALCVQWSRTAMWKTIERFAELPPETARAEFDLGKDGRDWSVRLAKQDVRDSGPSEEFITPILYRPFDVRYTYWTGHTKGFLAYPRREVMQHVLVFKNVAMIFNRQIVGDRISHFGVSRTPICHGTFYLGNKGQDYMAPLHLLPEADLLQRAPRSKVANLTDAFLAAVSGKLRQKPDLLALEDIFNYAYAVFHSPAYRGRYAEFLKRDFPRLPLTGNLELFHAMAQLGGELVALHLLESPELDKPTTEYTGGRSPQVEKVSWSRNTVWIDTGLTVGFRGVPEAVWNFHIGGYQVCEKWLKDRKGRTLTADDRTHYQKIVVALSETIRLMQEIDRVIKDHGDWPLK